MNDGFVEVSKNLARY